MQIPSVSIQNTLQWSCSLKIYISGNTTCVNCVKASVNLTEFVHSFTVARFILVMRLLFASFGHIMTV